jgi:hypothetical protein
MPRNGTLLITIRDHVLSLECRCGHRALIDISDVRPKLPGDASVQTVIDRARCQKCGRRGDVLHSRIVYDNLRSKA